MKLISGLGNPTRKYRLTRHNIGFLAIDKIAKNLCIRLKKDTTFSSLIGKGNFGGEKIILLKPITFINLSGEAIGAFARKRRINSDEIMVICDDVNLDLGKIRIRESGASGGHNGLKSIIENLDTERFPKLRIGIGRRRQDRDLSEYVLEKFSRTELILVDKILDVVFEAIKAYLVDGIDIAMSRFNNVMVT